MRAMLENLLPKFSDGAFLSFVVGNSRIHGRDIENDKLIIEAAGDLGISHFVTLTRDIKQNRKSFNLRNSRLKSEKIVVLRLQ
jgi:site-specific DNA-methyltransferase (cytosine-N4-specific)